MAAMAQQLLKFAASKLEESLESEEPVCEAIDTVPEEPDCVLEGEKQEAEDGEKPEESLEPKGIRPRPRPRPKPRPRLSRSRKPKARRRLRPRLKRRARPLLPKSGRARQRRSQRRDSLTRQRRDSLTRTRSRRS